MSQEIAVNTSTLASDTQDLQTQLDAVKRSMNQMYDAMQTLDAMWDGPANDAFRAQFSRKSECFSSKKGSRLSSCLFIQCFFFN